METVTVVAISWTQSESAVGIAWWTQMGMEFVTFSRSLVVQMKKPATSNQTPHKTMAHANSLNLGTDVTENAWRMSMKMASATSSMCRAARILATLDTIQMQRWKMVVAWWVDV